jgi:hypothetical protein
MRPQIQTLLATKKKGGDWNLNSGFEFAKQMLYCLSHTSSPKHFKKIPKKVAIKVVQGCVPVAHACSPSYSGGPQFKVSPGK